MFLDTATCSMKLFGVISPEGCGPGFHLDDGRKIVAAKYLPIGR
jgi:hypothetical protein